MRKAVKRALQLERIAEELEEQKKKEEQARKEGREISHSSSTGAWPLGVRLVDLDNYDEF